MKYIGIDGCKSGWLYVGLDDDLNWTIDIMANISELSALSRNSTLILIDIPIGLREAGRIERLCDLEARKNLEGRRSSVFPAPSRPALNGPTYRECSQINFEITGRKLSQQSYAIAPKIKEVDDYLATLDLRGKIREIHPEVCFWALNNYTPMRYRKKSPEGEMERIDLLKKHLDCTNHIIEKSKLKFRKKDAELNDVIDALAGAVTARLYQSLGTLPAQPEIDSRGLQMEMVFAKI